MKKILWCTCILLVLAGTIVCSAFYVKKNIHARDKEIVEEVSGGTLYVYGKKITSKDVTIHYRDDHSSYSDLPFTELLQSLGFNVEWIDSNTANILCNDDEYILNLSEATFLKAEDSKNLILPLPDGQQTYTILYKELILDTTTITNAVRNMGKDICVKLDYEKNIVYITDS